ncbi:hypothetical protein [Bdellovibrio sp. HCB2-146]|uniref:hypothetical protein n=1 Tax=Bdellovibrio sp. HCB2-146 TaxID=3394362 RepID=UPI0039BD6458
MKLRNLRRKVASFGVVSALSVLCLSYQNCARPRFNVDESLKASTLTDSNVFGRDPGVDPSADPSDNRDPGDDPVAGGDPRDPGSDNPTTGGDPRDPGSDNPTGSDPRNPGADSGTKKFVEFEYVCPVGTRSHGAYKPLISASQDLKLVLEVENFQSGNKYCEVPNVRTQMDQNRKVDVTVCASMLKEMFVNIYVVESTVTSDFKKYKINLNGGENYSSIMPLKVIYTDMNDKANVAGCDMVGDPLLVQLTKTGQPEPILLTSPEKGVQFDLLGRRNNYEKVQTSWFATSESENYFLVLPDASGAVKGIDQLFGDATLGPDKRFAKQGFAALAKHDDDRDKMISDTDSVYSQLRLWKDANLDGIAQETELFTLDEKGVLAIDLRYDRRYKERDEHGNMVKFKSIVIMKDNSYGLVYDLWLKYILQ